MAGFSDDEEDFELVGAESFNVRSLPDSASPCESDGETAVIEAHEDSPPPHHLQGLLLRSLPGLYPGLFGGRTPPAAGQCFTVDLGCPTATTPAGPSAAAAAAAPATPATPAAATTSTTTAAAAQHDDDDGANDGDVDDDDDDDDDDDGSDAGCEGRDDARSPAGTGRDASHARHTLLLAAVLTAAALSLTLVLLGIAASSGSAGAGAHSARLSYMDSAAYALPHVGRVTRPAFGTLRGGRMPAPAAPIVHQQHTLPRRRLLLPWWLAANATAMQHSNMTSGVSDTQRARLQLWLLQLAQQEQQHSRHVQLQRHAARRQPSRRAPARQHPLRQAGMLPRGCNVSVPTTAWWHLAALESPAARPMHARWRQLHTSSMTNTSKAAAAGAPVLSPPWWWAQRQRAWGADNTTAAGRASAAGAAGARNATSAGTQRRMRRPSASCASPAGCGMQRARAWMLMAAGPAHWDAAALACALHMAAGPRHMTGARAAAACDNPLATQGWSGYSAARTAAPAAAASACRPSTWCAPRATGSTQAPVCAHNMTAAWRWQAATAAAAGQLRSAWSSASASATAAAMWRHLHCNVSSLAAMLHTHRHGVSAVPGTCTGRQWQQLAAAAAAAGASNASSAPWLWLLLLARQQQQASGGNTQRGAASATALFPNSNTTGMCGLRAQPAPAPLFGGARQLPTRPASGGRTNTAIAPAPPPPPQRTAAGKALPLPSFMLAEPTQVVPPLYVPPLPCLVVSGRRQAGAGAAPARRNATDGRAATAAASAAWTAPSASASDLWQSPAAAAASPAQAMHAVRRWVLQQLPAGTPGLSAVMSWPWTALLPHSLAFNGSSWATTTGASHSPGGSASSITLPMLPPVAAAASGAQQARAAQPRRPMQPASTALNITQAHVAPACALWEQRFHLSAPQTGAHQAGAQRQQARRASASGNTTCATGSGSGSMLQVHSLVPMTAASAAAALSHQHAPHYITQRELIRRQLGLTWHHYEDEGSAALDDMRGATPASFDQVTAALGGNSRRLLRYRDFMRQARAPAEHEAVSAWGIPQLLTGAAVPAAAPQTQAATAAAPPSCRHNAMLAAAITAAFAAPQALAPPAPARRARAALVVAKQQRAAQAHPRCLNSSSSPLAPLLSAPPAGAGKAAARRGSAASGGVPAAEPSDSAGWITLPMLPPQSGSGLANATAAGSDAAGRAGRAHAPFAGTY